MSQFSNNEWFEVERCCNCGMSFAMTTDFMRRRRDDRKMFYCPAGHPQHYTGKTEAQKLKEDLERKNQMLDAAQARAATAEREREQVTKAHQKMRTRVMNGVCPCCNRTFQNLMQHMQSEHPEFREQMTLATLRAAFGMTQADVAKEAGVNATHVSQYEREYPVSAYAKERLDKWVERHNVKGELS